MKSMLYVSLLLMTLAGVAGSVNFTKMFKSGEIDKLYSKEEMKKKVVKSHEVAVITPDKVVTKPAIIHQRKQNGYVDSTAILLSSLEEILDSNQYNNSDVVVPDVAEKMDTINDNIAKNAIEANNGSVKSDDDKSVEETELTPKHTKFKLSMYSRGMIASDEREEEVDSVATQH